ncbi:PAS domain S-box-containing protein/diguanylate cyclase (GGDEF) domain-containing protein [Granulicatella balaenopterae]|uniref:PAS domain S-box-containing protein/diguanylate cyclase (GGDEF) domain-containing protein n=1 Tax=Granulicatella balaenopterae TaxID=137733 RepID=A0A1H9MUH1_9LACT|nr:GGDEF domain-containing protein [Granulicatella balaenopterae]SER27167.1 PAS domain S-box-containing protein/diguanylate cyclase (GGDEF) domain-containing protein [Granulicatella balaenopterae]
MDYQLKQLQQGYDLQSEIIKYTPGGMHVCYLSDPIHLEYASDGLCNMLGYTREEFEEKTGQLYLENIVPEDHHIFLDFVKYLAKNLEALTCEYRMVCKDGSIIIVSDKMESKLCSDGIIRGYSSVTDITKQKIIAQELEEQKEQYKQLYTEIKQSEERFRMISSFSGILFYEYDTTNNACIAFENIEHVLLYNNAELKQKLAEYRSKHESIPILGGMFDLVYGEDKPLLLEQAEILKEKGHVSTEVRMLCGDNQYHWFLIDIYRSGNDATIEMGCIRNIDATRNELDTLKLKTMLDPMTNLMNKVSAFQVIDQHLNKEYQDNALLFLDIDNFKAVNDQLGHEIGDKVICYVAEILQDTFRQRDVLVRYGGDEFMVFMTNVRHKEAVFRRAMEILQDVAKCPYTKDTNIDLSVSIGIAFSKEGSTARSLCLEADEATYKVKNNGKNGIYNKHFVFKNNGHVYKKTQ